MLLLSDNFFPKVDDVVCYFFIQNRLVLEKNDRRKIMCFGFGKWIVSPKAVDGFVGRVSKYVNISIYFVDYYRT